jgi:hypothetical protein
MELSKKDYENAFNLQDSTKTTISALLSLSAEACRLSEMFGINEDDITNITRNKVHILNFCVYFANTVVINYLIFNNLI